MGQICCKDEEENIKVNSYTRRHRNGDSLQHYLVREQHCDFHDVYDVVGLIGEGSISNIYKITKKKPSSRLDSNVRRKRSLLRKTPKLARRGTKTGEVYALKEIDFSYVREGYVDELRNEIELLKDLDHPNIIKVGSHLPETSG